MTMNETVRVDLAERSYDIVIGRNLLEDAGDIVGPLLSRPRAAVLVDGNVEGLHLHGLLAGLQRTGIACDWHAVQCGESAKSWGVLQDTVEWLIEIGMERQDVVIAFGGGVVGDLAGFAAAVTLRGLKCIQIPTTLLAQVDSSVGGKTGINSKSGKNLIGCFHQPSLVLCDVALLETLPKRDLLSGYGEVAKYGLLGDAEFFAWLEGNGPKLAAGDFESLIRAVRRSCEIKAGIVAKDETEHGLRALLNLGHTFAHAFEADAGYSNHLLHGEAVAVGCCLAFDLSHETGAADAAVPERVRRHFRSMGMCTDIHQLAVRLSPAERLMSLMELDKKVINGRQRFVLANDVGSAFVADDVSPSAVRRVLDRSSGRDPA